VVGFRVSLDHAIRHLEQMRGKFMDSRLELYHFVITYGFQNKKKTFEVRLIMNKEKRIV
jgi:hypothetical protein